MLNYIFLCTLELFRRYEIYEKVSKVSDDQKKKNNPRGQKYFYGLDIKLKTCVSPFSLLCVFCCCCCYFVILFYVIVPFDIVRIVPF